MVASPAVKTALYAVLGLSSAAVTVAGVRRLRPAARWRWFLPQHRPELHRRVEAVRSGERSDTTADAADHEQLLNPSGVAVAERETARARLTRTRIRFMGRWLAADVPEWLVLAIFAGGLPALLIGAQRLVHRWVPHWRSGEHNDVAGIMLSITALVYSVAMGLCVVTLWEQRIEAREAIEAEAMNLAAVAEGAGVFDEASERRVSAGVLAYNQDVLSSWPERVHGYASPSVGADLDNLVETVGGLTARNEAQQAFLRDAVARLAEATELRASAVRVAREQHLPGPLWVAVVIGSVVVLALCLTCGVRDAGLRRILLAGVAVTVGVNLFLAIELNYPFLGRIAVEPDSYRSVVAGLSGQTS